jgi:hypothetical protein
MKEFSVLFLEFWSFLKWLIFGFFKMRHFYFIPHHAEGLVNQKSSYTKKLILDTPEHVDSN